MHNATHLTMGKDGVKGELDVCKRMCYTYQQKFVE
jgi:hypothetical protein